MKSSPAQSSSLSNATGFRGFLDLLLARFPERSQAIFTLRFGLDTGNEQTLEEIGKTYSITRERVRQVVDVMQKKMRTALKEATNEPVIARVHAALEEACGVMTVEHLTETLTKADRREGKALQALLPIIPGIVLRKETDEHKASVSLEHFDHKEWCDVVNKAVTVLKKENDVVDFKRLHTLFVESENGQTEMLDVKLRCWLTPTKAIEKNPFGQYGLCSWETVRPRGTRERAHLILKVFGKPLHFREIARLIDEHGLYKSGKKTHPQTVHNELIKDKRFVLVGRGTYALSEWGYTKGTVRQVLANILKEKATPMTREDLLKEVMKVRQVKKSTVIINLNSFFAKVGKNIYTLRDTQ